MTSFLPKIVGWYYFALVVHESPSELIINHHLSTCSIPCSCYERIVKPTGAIEEIKDHTRREYYPWRTIDRRLASHLYNWSFCRIHFHCCAFFSAFCFLFRRFFIFLPEVLKSFIMSSHLLSMSSVRISGLKDAGSGVTTFPAFASLQSTWAFIPLSSKKQPCWNTMKY